MKYHDFFNPLAFLQALLLQRQQQALLLQPGTQAHTNILAEIAQIQAEIAQRANLNLQLLDAQQHVVQLETGLPDLHADVRDALDDYNRDTLATIQSRVDLMALQCFFAVGWTAYYVHNCPVYASL